MGRRLSERNKQKMFYASFLQNEADYVLDDDGNKIIEGYDSDGTPYYRESGTETPVYDVPVEFKSSISGQLNELHMRAWGIDNSALWSEIQCVKGYLPLKVGDKVWKDSVVTYKDADETIPDASSADYTVMGILTEYIDYDWFLLQRSN